MTALSFIALDQDAGAACKELARRWQCAARPESTPPPGCVLVIARVDAQGLARIGEYFAAHREHCATRSMIVCLEKDGQALRRLLAMGVGEVLEDAPDIVEAIAARLKRWTQIDAAVARPVVRDNLIGGSVAWRALLRALAECAMFSTAPVLLTGPTGTGKELLARLLHTLDTRASKRELVTVDCTTLAPDLAGSELFGHERGAFTGAVGERDGALAMADGGTLFLDEVGELSSDHQARLLRVLQEHAFRRIGGSTWRRSEFRLVCATNRELRAEVAAGRFRADLFHRIAALTLRTPALAERRDDIPALVRHFIERERGVGDAPGISPALLEYLVSREFGGNVRELAQLVQACLRRYAGAGVLSLGTLPEDEVRASSEVAAANSWDAARVEQFVRAALQAQVGLKELARVVEAAAVRVAVAESESLTAAATRLGVTPRALHLRRAAERDSSRH